MKFFTLVLFNGEFSSDLEIEEYVKDKMEPFKLVEDDDLPYNHGWKWDYYCLYEKDHMAKFGFKEPEFEFIQENSIFVTYPTNKLKPEHMTFAIITPEGKWVNGPYPLEKQDPMWPEKAVQLILETNEKIGVYVYCHS